MYYHFSHKPLKFEDLRDIKPEEQLNWFKPNGLWLSYELEWLEFAIIDNSSYFKDRVKYAAEVRLKRGSMKNLLYINSWKAVLEITEKYGELRGEIRWDKISKDYDGIIVSNYTNVLNQFHNQEKYIKRVTQWFSTFDINCICLWNLSNTLKSVIPIDKKILLTK